MNVPHSTKIQSFSLFVSFAAAADQSRRNDQQPSRYQPPGAAEVRSFGTDGEAQDVLRDWQELIPRGLGRCYGDSSLNSHILSTLKYNRFLEFDKELGILRCQSGVSLDEMLQVIVPAGWFLPVTPGTKFVTFGGAIAADIHGKNHHGEGSFSTHLDRFKLLAAGGHI